MKQKYFYSILLLFISFFGFSQTLDQENAPLSIGGGSFNVSSTQDVGQSFTAGMTGNLSQINIRVGNWGAYFVAGDFQLRIIDGNGYGGTVLNSTTFSITTAPATNNYDELEIVLSSTVPITSGSMYTIDVKGLTGKVNIHGTGGGGPDYTDGLFYSDGSPFNYYSLWFKTFVNVPKPATHLNFDGVDDYVTISNESAFDFTNQMTVEFWMNSNTLSDQWDALIAKGDDSWRVALTSTGTIAFTGSGAFTDFYSTTSVTDGNWHHVAVSYDGAFAKIYIDGSLESQLAGTSNINNSSYNVSLGENLQMLGRVYTGNMDEVRIWNTARTIDQINASKNCELQGNEMGLVAYYQFNQGVDQANNSGVTTLTDATTNANNGTLSNFALNGATSNWLAGSPVTTGSTIPSIPSATTSVVYNQGDTASTLTATAGANGTGLNWYDTAGTLLSGAPTPSTVNPGSTSYWVSSTNANGCESDRVEIVVTVNVATTAAPTTTWTTQVYTGDNKTIANIQVTGSNIIWYDSPTGGSVLPAATTPLLDGGTAYASQTVGGVESIDRLAVTVKRISDDIQTLPPASTVANLVTTSSTGATAQWFANNTGGTALPDTDVLTNGVYYVEQQTVAGVETLGSGFSLAHGVAIQPDGRIVVADFGNNVIKRMNADGTNIEVLGSGFNSPYGVAIQADGKIVVVDYGNDAIKRMDADGTNMVTLGSGFINPTGVAIQTDGKIVVADSGNDAIKRMDANGTNMVTLGSGFSAPYGVAIQADGKIVVADSGNNVIKRMNADGTNMVTLGSGFSAPYGVAIQADGKIVVADSGNSAIKRMNADGTNMVTLGSGFYMLYGVAIQTDGKIVVADAFIFEIKRITEASTSNRVSVTVAISSPAAPTTTWTTQVYTGDDKIIDDIQVIGSNIIWYDSPTGGSVLSAATTLLVDQTIYYASQTVGGVESTDRLAVTVKRISDNTQTLPPASTVANLVSTPSTGATAQWFANNTGGTALPGTDVLTNGVYYVEQVSQSATVSTFVGTIQGNQDGDASTAQFYDPNDVVFDTSGNMFVADYHNHRIRKVTPSGVVSTFAGSTMGYADGNGTSAQFRFPTKLAFDLSGNLLVCDAQNYKVRKISPSGDVTTLAGSTNGYTDGNGTAAQFSYLDGIAVNAMGEIFVSDQSNNRIRKIDTAGNVTTFVGDGSSNTTDGIGTAASIAGPAGMEFDTDGNLIVIEYDNGNLRKITPAGDISTIVGGFNYPEDIGIDNMNMIYVADTDNSAIKKVDQFGVVTNYAGGTLGDTDGDITTAEFGYTSGVTFHANELVFCDMENNKIKKITSEVSNRVPVNVDVTTLSASNFDVNSFKVYPNPSTGIFTISTQENVTIEVYDIVGKIVVKKAINIGENSIDITNYANGMYLLKTTNTSGNINTYKIIKQ